MPGVLVVFDMPTTYAALCRQCLPTMRHPLGPARSNGTLRRCLDQTRHPLGPPVRCVLVGWLVGWWLCPPYSAHGAAPIGSPVLHSRPSTLYRCCWLQGTARAWPSVSLFSHGVRLSASASTSTSTSTLSSLRCVFRLHGARLVVRETHDALALGQYFA
jgi:hypothetical protein